MTNASTIRHVRIDERSSSSSSSNRRTNLDRSIVDHRSRKEEKFKNSCREMSFVNEEESEEERRFARQDRRGSGGSCRLESSDFSETKASLRRFDNVLNDVIENIRSFRESDSSDYERIADLQEFLREESIEDKRGEEPAVGGGGSLDPSFGRRRSFKEEDAYDRDCSEGATKVKHSVARNRPYSKNPGDRSPRSSMRNPFEKGNFLCKRRNADHRSYFEKNEKRTEARETGGRSILNEDWSVLGKNEKRYLSDGTNARREGPASSIPSIVVNVHGESSVSRILEEGSVGGGAQLYSDGSSNSILSPGSRIWVDSPLSCYNVAVSGPNSRCSSRAQSPGSGMQFESQLMPYNVAGSPLGSPQVLPTYATIQGQSSPSSSSQSYSDAPSPLNYQTPLAQRMEEQLHEDLACFSIWGTFGSEGQGSSTGNDTVVASFDSNELQLVDEVLRDLGNKCEVNEDAQVVPNSSQDFPRSFEVLQGSSDVPRSSSGTSDKRDAHQPRVSPSSFPSTYADERKPGLVKLPDYSSARDRNDLASSYLTDNANTTGIYDETRNQLVSFYNDYNDVTGEIERETSYVDSDALRSGMEYLQFGRVGPTETSIYTDDKNFTNDTNFATLSTALQQPSLTSALASALTSSSASTGVQENGRRSTLTELSLDRPSFNEFQIPEMVSSFRPAQPIRSTERNIVPWPSLNLPSIGASERLKAGLNAKEVEKAMVHLLKKPVEELARGDEDGDTELMRLVGNPEELARKKAYLVPLVERLTNVKGALSMTNNRGEDALYLAAINCPEMPYVAGYLAATMLEKGIDINQKLYHTRGDSLIHSVAARGDSHGEVLAELLALKTIQGNALFDLSRRNYDGRTALHVAVESHDPTTGGSKAVATVRFLLDNGADPNVKETKCGDTALHMAAALSCDPALVKVFLNQASPDTVNATDYNYNTPLHMAAAASNTVPVERQKEVCWLLLQAGGHSNVQNRQGKTPLALVSPARKDLIRRTFYKKF